MCLAQGPQRSDAGEAQTRDPSVSSQTLYHRATVLTRIFLHVSIHIRWILNFICWHEDTITDHQTQVSIQNLQM